MSSVALMGLFLELTWINLCGLITNYKNWQYIRASVWISEYSRKKSSGNHLQRRRSRAIKCIEDKVSEKWLQEEFPGNAKTTIDSTMANKKKKFLI